jgi:meso-butanediol dehydrogenase / (S,S)-butanediol dehydrogenase / diacetyl reductase
MLLHDRVILLTGGSSGIGWECAKAYAAEGALVVILANDRGGVAAAVEQLGDQHMGVFAEVGDDASVQSAVEATLKRYGRIDAVHNNAGIATPSKPLHLTEDAEWELLLHVNLKGVLHTTRHAYAALCASRGSILNTSSLVGVIGQANHAAYCATKGGLNALTKAMAVDYAAVGIRVNAVCPAGVWTPMLHAWVEEQPNAGAIKQYLDDIHLLGACPHGDVIADACVFLLSDKARFITGHLMHVSGGAELGYRRTN